MEHVEAEFEALERIAQNSGGDARSAINDLQSLTEKSRALKFQDTTRLTPRNKDIGMYDTLKGVFSAKSLGEAATMLNRSNADHDDLLLSISDNLPLRYEDPADLSVAYDLVSRADVFRGRIGTENWHLLRYFYNFLAEAATVHPQSYRPFEFIFPPMRIIALFWTKSKRMAMERICAKIGARCHVSRKTAKQEFVPFVKILLEKEKSKAVASWLKLDTEEIDYLTKMNKL
jgi:replication factor C large subunit